MTPLLFIATMYAAWLPPADGDIELGPTHVDASFGYSVRPPKDWLIQAERSTNPRDTLLLQMVEPGSGSFPPDITVRLYATPRGSTVEQVLADVKHLLTNDYGDVKQLPPGSPGAGTRDPGRAAFRFTVSRTDVIRQVSVIRVRPDLYFVLSYTGPVDTHERGERVFDAVLHSFRLLENEKTDKAVQAGLERTREWVRKIRSVKLAEKLQAPLYLRVTVDGRERGYLIATEEPFVHRNSEGVCVAERGWTFNSDGSATHTSTRMFLSLDGEMEQWENRVRTVIPASSATPAALEQVLYEGLRERSVLLTSRSTQYGRRPRNDPKLDLPDGYLSRVLVRWLPRLVDLSKPALFAFTGYDHERRGLVLRTLEIKGQVEKPPAGLATPVFLARDREGLSGPPADLYFDANGRLLRMVAGSIRMDATDESTVHRRWERETTAIEAEVAKLQQEFDNALKRFPRPGEELKPDERKVGNAPKPAAPNRRGAP